MQLDNYLLWIRVQFDQYHVQLKWIQLFNLGKNYNSVIPIILCFVITISIKKGTLVHLRVNWFRKNVDLRASVNNHLKAIFSPKMLANYKPSTTVASDACIRQNLHMKSPNCYKFIEVLKNVLVDNRIMLRSVQKKN